MIFSLALFRRTPRGEYRSGYQPVADPKIRSLTEDDVHCHRATGTRDQVAEKRRYMVVYCFWWFGLFYSQGSCKKDQSQTMKIRDNLAENEKNQQILMDPFFRQPWWYFNMISYSQFNITQYMKLSLKHIIVNPYSKQEFTFCIPSIRLVKFSSFYDRNFFMINQIVSFPQQFKSSRMRIRRVVLRASGTVVLVSRWLSWSTRTTTTLQSYMYRRLYWRMKECTSVWLATQPAMLLKLHILPSTKVSCF